MSITENDDPGPYEDPGPENHIWRTQNSGPKEDPRLRTLSREPRIPGGPRMLLGGTMSKDPKRVQVLRAEDPK